MQKKSMLDLHRVDVEQYKTVEKIPVAVVLDDVRSEMNVGSVMRTADAFVIGVEWTHYSTALEAVEQLRSEGYTICSIEQVHGSVSLERFAVEPGKKYALVFGNEVKGVSQAVVDASDCCIEIPQHGTKHSLNIACSAAIVMWQFFNSIKN